MAEWSNDVGNILNGIGGNNGIGDDIAAVINASNGTPQTVVYADNGGNMPMPINWPLIIGGAVVLIVAILLLRK